MRCCIISLFVHGLVRIAQKKEFAADGKAACCCSYLTTAAMLGAVNSAQATQHQ
jgi:hypothetical protein